MVPAPVTIAGADGAVPVPLPPPVPMVAVPAIENPLLGPAASPNEPAIRMVRGPDPDAGAGAGLGFGEGR